MSFEQDLAGLGADRLEMARRYAFAGNLARLIAVKSVEHLGEAGAAVLEQIVVPGPVQQAASLVEVIGARLGPDQRLATIQKKVPLFTRQPLLADVTAQTPRFAVSVEPLDD